MEDQELATYAKGLARALRTAGPAPRCEVLAMLSALRLAPEDRQAVIDYALAHGILSVDGGRIGVANALFGPAGESDAK
jgi:hypothetical protein